MSGKGIASFLFAFGALAAVLVTVSGCEDMGGTADTALPEVIAPSYPQLSSIAPPPRTEEAPMLQDPINTIWRPGYWEQSGSGFDWVSGEVIARPVPTAVWAPSYWAKREYGWAFVPGYWQ